MMGEGVLKRGKLAGGGEGGRGTINDTISTREDGGSMMGERGGGWVGGEACRGMGGTIRCYIYVWSEVQWWEWGRMVETLHDCIYLRGDGGSTMGERGGEGGRGEWQEGTKRL